MDAGEASSIERGPEGVTAPGVFAAYRAGDALAASVVGDAIGYLGAALTTWVNILDPGMVVIGGGLSNEWGDYIEPAVRVMRQQAFAEQSRAVPVVPPSLGAEAGALGAIALAAGG